MPTQSARRTGRVANAIAAIAGPTAVALLLAWIFRWPAPIANHPQAVMMAFMLFDAATVGALVASTLSRCHLAVADAFSAGVRVGASVAPPQQAGKPGLRVVE